MVKRICLITQEMQGMLVRFWIRKIPWRRKWHPTPVFLPGESHGQRSLAGCSLWGRKESDTTERLSTLTPVARGVSLNTLNLEPPVPSPRFLGCLGWKKFMPKITVKVDQFYSPTVTVPVGVPDTLNSLHVLRLETQRFCRHVLRK